MQVNAIRRRQELAFVNGLFIEAKCTKVVATYKMTQ